MLELLLNVIDLLFNMLLFGATAVGMWLNRDNSFKVVVLFILYMMLLKLEAPARFYMYKHGFA